MVVEDDNPPFVAKPITTSGRSMSTTSYTTAQLAAMVFPDATGGPFVGGLWISDWRRANCSERYPSHRSRSVDLDWRRCGTGLCYYALCETTAAIVFRIAFAVSKKSTSTSSSTFSSVLVEMIFRSGNKVEMKMKTWVLFEQPTANSQFRTVNSEQRTANSQFRTANFELRTWDEMHIFLT